MTELMERVPWLSRQHISGAADSLLQEYESFLGCPVEPPISVEAIIEQYLGLRLEYDDLETRLGCTPDITFGSRENDGL